MTSAAFVADVADRIFIVFSLKSSVCAMCDDDLLTHTWSVGIWGVGCEDGRPGERKRGNCFSIPFLLFLQSPGLSSGDALRGNERQIRIANANLVVILKRMCLVNFAAVHKSAVSRQVVLDQESSIPEDDDGMRTADRFVFKHYVADRICANAVIAGVEPVILTVRIAVVTDEPADNLAF